MALKQVLRNRPQLKRRQIFNRAVIGVTAAYLGSLGLIFYFNTYTKTSTANALSGYKFRKSINIDSSFVTGNKDLKNYKLLIQHRDADLKHVSFGGHVEDMNGNDIHFTDKSGKEELNFEIESYNETSGEITAWVTIPVLNHNNSTTLFMYYGNPISIENSSKNTWEKKYKAVYHLRATGMDVSSYSNHASLNGTKTTLGMFANAQSFDGIDDYIKIDYASELSINDSLTISAWIKPSSFNKSYQCILGKQYGGSYQDNVFLGINSKRKNIEFYTYDCGIEGLKNELTENEWYYVVAAAKDNKRILYINGIEVVRNEICNGPWLKDINPLSIGAQENSANENEYSDWFSGTIDEVRISNSYPNADEVKTEYYNYANPSQFYFIGKEEQFTSSNVQLLYFKSDVLKENTVMVEWATASEVNNLHYKVLRCNANGIFEEIETVPAGKGNELKTYKIIDTNPIAGKNQYKLLQQSNDGQISSFGPISVDNNFAEQIIGDLRILSSGSNQKVKLHFNCSVANELSLTIKNISGNTVVSRNINTEPGVNQIELETTAAMENGLYVAQFTGSGMETITAKVVKF